MNEEDVDNNVEEPFTWEIKPPYHKFVWAIVSSIGWYIVAISIVLIYTWPYVSKKLKSWKNKMDEKEYDAKYHKNVDLSSKLLMATQLARERQQEQYLREREIALKKEEERKERKRQDLLRLRSEGSSGYRLNSNSSSGADASPSSSSKSTKSKLKPDYNPLMGESSSSRYQAPKRSCCKKGGGCG